MAASRVTGFPVSITAAATGTVVPKNIGDLMIVAGRRGSNVVDVTAISGGGCTNWTKVTEKIDATDFIYGFMWMGTVSTIGSQTITFTVTDPGNASEITVDSFTAGVAGPWAVDVSAPGGNPASVPTFPSLTPTKSASTPIPELYYGWMFTTNTYNAGAGATPGYHYEDNPFVDGPIAFSTNVVSGAQQPTFPASSSTWIAVAAIFYVAAPNTPYRNLILGETGLVSYWRLGEPSGSALDYKGSNPGTVLGGVVRGVSGLIVNDSDGAVRSDGVVGSYVSVPHAANLMPSTTVTLEAWIRFPTTVVSGYVVGKGTTNFFIDGYGLSMAAGLMPNWIVVDANSVQRAIDSGYAANKALAAGTNYHLVGVYSNPGEMELFVNGASVGKSTLPNANLFANTGAVRMFVSPTTAAPMVAVIDEVAVYNVALTPAQILNHYEMGLGVVLPTSIDASPAAATASPAAPSSAVNAFVPAA